MDISKEQAVINLYKKGPDFEGLYGYGSAVFPQSGYDKKKDLTIDTLCIVNNVSEYLLRDLELNPNNYSPHQKKFILSKGNDKIKGKNKIVFFTGARSNGYQIKRGIAQLDDTQYNVSTGDILYLLWRFQKPVFPFKTTEKIEKTIIKKSQIQGVLMGLLTLEEDKNTFYDLYLNIYGLSYKGDIRNGLFENPDKVKNSVEKNFDNIKKIYEPIHENLGIITEDDLKNKREILLDHINDLLPCVNSYLINNNVDVNSLKDVRDKLNYFIRHQNMKESITQPIQGLRVNGLTDSMTYLGCKIEKSIGGYKKRLQSKK